MASFSDFMPDIAPWVGGCPTIMIEQAILNATIEFCRESLWWRVDHDPITAMPSVSEYDLSAPSGSAIIRPVSATFEGDDLPPKDTNWLDANVTDWQTDEGNIYYFNVPSHGTVRLVRIPEKLYLNALRVRMALMPSRTATTIDDTIYNHHYETIGHGAKARLMAVPDKPWSNPGEAAYYAGLFEQAVSKARIEAEMGYAGATQSVKWREFGL